MSGPGKDVKPSFKTLMVDDMRLPNFPETVTLFTEPMAAVEKLKEDTFWPFLYLDHDLGQDADGKTIDIWPVVNYLVENRKRLEVGFIYIISSNPVGANNMKTALDNAGFLTIILREDHKTMLFHHRDWIDM